MNIFQAENLYFLGPQGTYAQKAMQQFEKELGIKANKIIPINPITTILQKLDQEKNSIAVLPIENSIEGIVRETIDNIIKLKDKDIKIIAETIIPINHCLISKGTNKSEIKSIISHSQALGQCTNYICKNFKEIKIIQSASTSEAAKSLNERDETYAAIASETAAEIYGLNILDKKINDEQDNKTRFILLARGERERTGYDKTSLFFSINNEAGALFNVLSIFNIYKINMLYIDSRPSRKKMGEYNFSIDVEGHKTDKKLEAAINLVAEYTGTLTVTGSYPRYKS
jgi:prephenate dehydratase